MLKIYNDCTEYAGYNKVLICICFYFNPNFYLENLFVNNHEYYRADAFLNLIAEKVTKKVVHFKFAKICTDAIYFDTQRRYVQFFFTNFK